MLKAKEVKYNSYVEFASPELMFLAESGQPYRGNLYIQMVTNGKTLDLLAFKKYITSLRSETIVLEDSAGKIYTDIFEVLGNDNMCVTVTSAPRGGISGTVRHGKDFRDPKQKAIVFGIQ